MLRFFGFGAVLLALTGFGFAQPVLTGLSPSSALVGSGILTLTITGTGFTGLNSVQWDGATIPSTFVNSTSLTATVSAALMNVHGGHAVRVRTSSLFATFSNTLTFNVRNPVPTLSSISPTSAIAGAASVNLTATGANFNSTSVVRWGGVSLPTTLVSSTQLTAVVSSALLATGGNVDVTVHNPVPGGGTTSVRTFAVQNPIPSLGAISPNVILRGSPTTVLTATGSGFITGSSVLFAGSPLPTTFVSSTTLTASIDASLLTTLGGFFIRVRPPAPSAGDSNGITLDVVNLIPTLTAISPSSIFAYPSTDPVFTVTGSNFAANAIVEVNSAPITPTSSTPTSLVFSLSAITLQSIGNRLVRVVNPGPFGGPSSLIVLNVIPTPPPTLTSTNPAQLFVQQTPPTIQLFGTNFNSSAVVRRDGVQIPYTLVSSSEITCNIASSFVQAPGTIALSIEVPSSQSPAVTRNLPVEYPAPVVSSVSPANTPVGVPATLVCAGSGFDTFSVITLNGVPLPTSFSAGTLSASVPAPIIAVAGSHLVRVENPTPGGGTSTAFTFEVRSPIPSLNFVTPSLLGATGQDTIVTLIGDNFTTQSVAHLTSPVSIPLTTAFVDSQTLTATVPGIHLLNLGTLLLRVVSPAPGGGPSPTRSVPVVNPLPNPLGFQPNPLIVSANPTLITVTGTDFVNGISARIGTGPGLPVTFVNPGAILVEIPASSLAVPSTFFLRLTNPAPTLSNFGTIPVTVSNLIPTITSISPSSIPMGSAATTNIVNGSNFHSLSSVEWASSPIPTTFINPNQLTAEVSASLLTAHGQRNVFVRNGTSSTLTSNTLQVSVLTPAPSLSVSLPGSLIAGSPGTTVSLLGSSLLSGGALSLNGVPRAFTHISDIEISIGLSAIDLASSSTLSFTFTNPLPNLGVVATLGVPVVGPRLNSLFPSSLGVVVPPTPGVLVTATGSGFLAGSTFAVADGLACITTVLSSGQLQFTIPGTHPSRHRPGGISIAVQNTNTSPSNSMAIAVGGFANVGTLVTHPLRTPPGTAFDLLTEGVPVGAPFTMIADLTPPPPIAPFPDPATNQVLSVLSGSHVAIVDGLGLFGSASGASFAFDAEGTVPFGNFTFPGLVKPAPAIGISVALQTVYIDPSSPIGIRLTWGYSPLDF